MGKWRWFRVSLVLGSVFMILLIILYWDDVGASHLYMPPLSPRPAPHHSPTHPTPSFLSDINAFVNQFLEGTNDPTDSAPPDSANQSEHAEERYVPRREWKVHLTPIDPEKRLRQERRRQRLHDLCHHGDDLAFPGKNRSFDDIPNRELDHLIVDDRHGIIYCYVPKVACSNWKRIMIVLSESLLQEGVPYRDPLAVPQEMVHNSSLHFTFNKFWKRYGKFSRHLMKICASRLSCLGALRTIPSTSWLGFCSDIHCGTLYRQVKLQKYTKFLFVRDPFVRLISAYRNKFEQPNEEFYRRFALLMLRRYGNHSEPPAAVGDAFPAGIRPSFSEFVQYLLDPKTESDAPFNEHWRQVYRLCHPCQIQYDFVGQLETVEEDAEQLLRVLKVDNVVDFPPSHRNHTASSWQEDWFSRVPLVARRGLYRLYEPDFRLFGYSRPDSLLD